MKQETQVHLIADGEQAESAQPPMRWEAECRSGDWLVISSDDKNSVLYPNSVRGKAFGEAACKLAGAAPELLATLIYARKCMAEMVGLPVAECVGGDFCAINDAIALASPA